MKITLTIVLLAAWVQSGAAAAQGITPEQRLAALGVALKAAPPAVANYVPAVRAGNLVFLAGQIPRGPEGSVLAGKLGRGVTTAQGAEAARICAVQLLAALKAEIGDLVKVTRIVRVGGFVNCTEDFVEQPKVVNGCSDLLVAVFRERGRHARAAVGVAALPMGAIVEVEMIVEVADR